jgi:hypothetical protein
MTSPNTQAPWIQKKEAYRSGLTPGTLGERLAAWTTPDRRNATIIYADNDFGGTPITLTITFAGLVSN